MASSMRSIKIGLAEEFCDVSSVPLPVLAEWAGAGDMPCSTVPTLRFLGCTETAEYLECNS